MTLDTPRDPEQAEAAHGLISAEIAPSTTRGAVHLTVTDLGRSIEYYEHTVGLAELERSDARVSLGVDGRELLVLVEEP
jgi:catechol-2,3-dioxygenase